MLEKNIFHKIIQQVDEIVNKSANDRTKLNHAGNLFYQGSLIILEKAQECLENELHPEITVAGEDTQVDESFKLFLNSLTQQSISTNCKDSDIKIRDLKKAIANITHWR
jgi:NADPH-dependent 7-cyano-7-deazaguanine reductase QueF-like protein